MRRLRLVLGLAVLGSKNGPIDLAGYGEDGGLGRCPDHPETDLVEERGGRLYCEEGNHYVEENDRLPP